jgi:predicted dehydrogenase
MITPAAAAGAISRRQFLRRTAVAAGAAVAFPTIVPAAALGRGGAVAPSARITMGFIGIGGQGGGHLFGGAWTYVVGGFAGREDVQVLAVCDVRRARLTAARERVDAHYAERLGRGRAAACAAYVDFRDVLARADIDAVLIATPAHWHATMAVMAAATGKDIYCEKPTACTIQESQAVRAAVRRHGRVYQAGTQQRSEYGGKFRLACEFVRSGRIGQLREIYCHRDGGAIVWPTRAAGAGKPVPDDLEWDLYLGPAPAIPYDGNAGAHRFDLGELNWGQHHSDIIQWAADADATGPVELFMQDGRSGFRYASGVTVYGRPHPEETVGGEGGACFVGTAGRIAVDRNVLVSTPTAVARAPLQPEEVHLPRNRGHADNFLDCVRTRQRPICDAEVAHRSASALLLGGIVKQVQRPLRWDPVAERFIGDEEAGRLLSMAKRAPWHT